MILGYGRNDPPARLTEEEYEARLAEIVAEIRAVAPDAEVVVCRWPAGQPVN